MMSWGARGRDNGSVNNSQKNIFLTKHSFLKYSEQMTLADYVEVKEGSGRATSDKKKVLLVDQPGYIFTDSVRLLFNVGEEDDLIATQSNWMHNAYPAHLDFPGAGYSMRSGDGFGKFIATLTLCGPKVWVFILPMDGHDVYKFGVNAGDLWGVTGASRYDALHGLLLDNHEYAKGYCSPGCTDSKCRLPVNFHFGMNFRQECHEVYQKWFPEQEPCCEHCACIKEA